MKKEMIISADQLVRIGHWHYDIENNRLYWSEEIQKIHGISRQPTLDEGIQFIRKGKHRERFRSHMSEAQKKGKPFEVEVQTISATGKRHWLRIWGAPEINNGKTTSIYGGTQDITEKKSRLDRLARVAEETQNAVIITDLDRKILWVNRAFETLTGYNAEEVMGRNPGDFLQGDASDEQVVQHMRRELDRESPFTAEIINYTKEGEPYWTKIDVSPIRNEDGDIVEFFSIQEEITEKKKAEKALKEERERLLFAQRVGKMGDWEYVPETGKMTWSSMMHRIFNHPKSDPSPDLNTFSDYLVHDGEKLKSAFEHSVNHQSTFAFDTEILTRNGQRKYIYIEGIPKTRLNGSARVYLLHGIVQDITARKLARNRMADREKQLRTTVNNVNGVLIRYQLLPNGDDRIVYISQGAEKMFGLKRGEILQSTSFIWDLIHPEDVDPLRNSIHKSAAEDRIWNQIFRLSTVDGEMKWVHGRGAPEKLPDGTTQWDTLILDATDTIRKEQMNDALLQEVHHRVKNNLAIIIALIQLEMMDLDSDGPALLPLERTATRIYSLSQVHEMLYGQDNLGSIDTKYYFSKLVNMVTETVPPDAEIETNIETNGIRMNVNELSPLGMLLNELLTNSMKYAFRKCSKGVIDVILKQEDDRYLLTYRDNGPGLSRERFENVETTGMRIIHILIQQLHADHYLTDPPGFGIEISFERVDRGAHGVEFFQE